MATANVKLVSHPLVCELISKLRDVNTDSQLFRIYLNDITRLLLYDALADLKTTRKIVSTQTGEEYAGKVINEKVAFVAILRASLGMLASAMNFFPQGEFHVLGMKRNEEDPYNNEPNFYLDRLHEMSPDIDRIVVMDPMLATGGSMVSALKAISERHKFKGKIQVVSLITAQKGANLIAQKFPKVTITCAGLDAKLNKNAYIIPGLGDAGDRLFGITTKIESIR